MLENQEALKQEESEFLDFEVQEFDIKKDVGTGPMVADMQASAMSVVLLLLV